MALSAPSARNLQDAWRLLSPEERAEGFAQLSRADAAEFFEELTIQDMAVLLRAVPETERRFWYRQLPPDDAADVLQEIPPEEREAFLGLLYERARNEVKALLVYAEDHAGGLMDPRYIRLRPGMTVDEAISYTRRQTRDQVELVYYAYALDPDRKLQGVVSLRELFSSKGDAKVEAIMEQDLVKVPEDMDQEEVARLLAQHDLLAVPVVDQAGRMKGIVTVDDAVDVVQEEATEDMQKLGGMEALETPYLETGILAMARKRGSWLAVLFFGGIVTAFCMQAYESRIQEAVVLAVFLPLIIASGGNSGSQATTLVIRAMALGEVSLADWWRVIVRELVSGLTLGALLAGMGVAQVLIGGAFFGLYGPHYKLLALTIALSLLGIVIWGVTAGSMLPFILRRAGFDPASASAPLVATVIDVSGVVLYFTAADLILTGSLL